MGIRTKHEIIQYMAVEDEKKDWQIHIENIKNTEEYDCLGILLKNDAKGEKDVLWDRKRSSNHKCRKENKEENT